MSGKPFDEKAKKRLARHVIGGDKQQDAEKSGKACPECGMVHKPGTKCSDNDGDE